MSIVTIWSVFPNPVTYSVFAIASQTNKKWTVESISIYVYHNMTDTTVVTEDIYQLLFLGGIIKYDST